MALVEVCSLKFSAEVQVFFHVLHSNLLVVLASILKVAWLQWHSVWVAVLIFVARVSPKTDA